MSSTISYLLNKHFLINRHNSKLHFVFIGLLLLLPLSVCGLAADANDAKKAEVKEKLTQAGEEDLLMFYEPGDIIVTSSARRPQAMKQATSAMYVITKEDIRQAGVTKFVDLLRLVPGMDVSQNTGTTVAAGARGFAQGANRRMQVLMDGRPVYDPWKGGVDFELQPIFLEDIERIEVIRGSGSVTWGVNAMNGVINIITKKTADTQGRLIYGGFGNRELQEGFMRVGGVDGPLGWRGAAGAFHDNGLGANGGDDEADWFQAFQSTGRADIKLSDDTNLYLSGGHKLSTGPKSNAMQKHSIQFNNLIWEKTVSDESKIDLRWSESWYKREAVTFDLWTREDMLEYSQSYLLDDHAFVWGADFTRDTYKTQPTHTNTDAADPDRNGNNQGSAFIEDEITLNDDLWLTIGTRQYYSQATHQDWAGTLALVWEFEKGHFLRSAVSRSFRRPMMSEEFTHTVSSTTGKVTGLGNDSLSNENLVSYELGYRGQLKENLELNIEGFVNYHEDLIVSRKLTAAENSARPDFFFNGMSIKTYGIENSIDWRPKNWWLVRAFYVYQHQTDEKQLNNTTTGKITMYSVPQHRAGLTNRFYFDDNTTLNTQLYWTDALYDPASVHVDPYFKLDVRLARSFWNNNAEFAIGVNNLQEHFHQEKPGSEIPRQVYVQFFYKF